MKIKCKFCDNMIDDTNAVCPHCGAPNENVVRTTKSQPQTIEELKQWYADRKLPPAEVTRFFIGTDYKGARAFGIYKDPASGNFVVYKNKDSGQRAVRYEGTDEAYAVNELFMRLKQEIIEQKQANAGRSAGSTGSAPRGRRKDPITIAKGLVTCVGAVFWLLTIVSFLGSFGLSEPKGGYYDLNGAYYYYFDDPDFWYGIDSSTGDWQSRPMDRASVPNEFSSKRKAKRYYKGKYWSEDLGMPNFITSTARDDYYYSYTDSGYYNYNGTHYYNMTGSLDDGWFSYDDSDDSWRKVEYEDVPEDLTHNSTVRDFYDTPTWDSSLQVSDFADTDDYETYIENDSYSSDTSYDSSDGWYDSSDDSFFDWGSDDSWDSDWDSDWGGSDSWDSDW